MWKFLRSEMLVILGLTEDAGRTDAEIADMYDLKKGTVSSVRRRLLDAGAVHYAYVPSFNRLGCEMLGFHIGETDPAIRSDTKANYYMEFCEHTPQIFYALIGGSSVVMFTALRHVTELEAFLQRHNMFFTGARRASKGKLTSVVFPYGLTRGTYVPQFAPLVHGYFELDVPKPKLQSVESAKIDPADLSDTEKSTLVCMVSNPSFSDREVASSIDLSRQAVTRIRNKLTSEGILTKVCIPRLYRWGFEICAVAHPRFDMEFSWDKRLKNQPKQVLEQAFYTLSKADEAVASYMIPKFTQYSEQLEEIQAWYHKTKIIEDKLDITLFSLERSTELRTFDFSQTVKHLLTPGPMPDDPAHRNNI